MRVTTPKRKRNKLVVALLLPAMIVMWMVGWSLYWIGRQRDRQPRHQPKRRSGGVTLIPAVVVEKEAIEVPQ